MQLNGSQIFVEVLCEQGVDTIFGYPGGAVLNLYDELYKNADLTYDIGLANICHDEFDSSHNGCLTLSIGVNF